MEGWSGPAGQAGNLVACAWGTGMQHGGPVGPVTATTATALPTPQCILVNCLVCHTPVPGVVLPFVDLTRGFTLFFCLPLDHTPLLASCSQGAVGPLAADGRLLAGGSLGGGFHRAGGQVSWSGARVLLPSSQKITRESRGRGRGSGWAKEWSRSFIALAVRWACWDVGCGCPGLHKVAQGKVEQLCSALGASARGLRRPCKAARLLVWPGGKVCLHVPAGRAPTWTTSGVQ